MIARPKISQNDLDLTSLESIELWAGRPGSLFDFATGGNTSLKCRYDVLGRPFSETDAVPKKAKLSKQQITDACEASLKRLGVDYIDLLETHWPSRYVPKFGETGARYNFALEHDHVSFEEQLEAMADLIKAGKVKAWGVSNETTFGVATFVAIAKLKGLPPPVSIQNDYSLCDRRFETELAEARRPGSKRNERTNERTKGSTGRVVSLSLKQTPQRKEHLSTLPV